MNKLKNWKKLSAISQPVVAVTQRESGLWPLPTSDYERGRLYARPDTIEGQLRANDPFGHESITVTWRALHALQRALGTLPSVILVDAFQAMEDLRAPNGAYGRRVEGWKSESSINESSRHTAAGLMAHFEFGSMVLPPAKIEDYVPSIHWLIDTQLEGGGWAYQQAHRELGFAPLSTSFCVAALSESLRCVGNSLVNEKSLLNKIDDALARGFDQLLLRRWGAIWAFEHDQRDTELSDAADLTWMLLKATERPSRLETVRPHAREEVVRIAHQIIDHALQNGMPGQVGALVPSLSASIHTLVMGHCLTAPELIPNIKVNLDRIERSIFREFKQNKFWHQLSTWDWCFLTQLSAESTGLSASVNSAMVATAQQIRHAGFAGTLLKQHLSVKEIPRESRLPILYALSRGRPSTIPSTRLEAIYSTLPIWSRWIIPQIPGAIAGFYFSKLMQLMN